MTSDNMIRVAFTGHPFGKALAAALLLLHLTCANASAVVNVRDCGARGDGHNIDTHALNMAIAKASMAGGDTVLVPAGKYLTYSLHLAGDVTLHLEEGAVITAAPVCGDAIFDLPEPGPQPQYQDFGHSHWHNSLIWGTGLENVTICGRGMIDGSALGNGKRTEDLLDGLANKAIALKECKHVTIKDITIYNGGHFAILATGVDDLAITGLTIDTNRDGIDIDCCKGVVIRDCRVNSPIDDAIVLKASYALGRFRDTEDVVISGCSISGCDTGTLLDGTFVKTPNRYVHSGRVKLGTESSGGFRNVTVTDCTFRSCGGIFIESEDGGGVEDITFRDLTMRDCSESPIFMRLGARMRSPEGTPVGHMRNIRIDNVRALSSEAAYPVMLCGIPGHRIENVTIKNAVLESRGGLSPEQAIGWDLPEAVEAYPDPWMFGPGRHHVMPFKGMMLRHVDGVTLDRVSMSFLSEDSRRLFWTDDALNVRLRKVSADGKRIKNTDL